MRSGMRRVIILFVYPSVILLKYFVLLAVERFSFLDIPYTASPSLLRSLLPDPITDTADLTRLFSAAGTRSTPCGTPISARVGADNIASSCR